MSKTTLIGGILLVSVASSVVFAWEKLLLPHGVYTCDSGGQIEFSGFLVNKSVRFERAGKKAEGELSGGDLRWQGDAGGLPKRVQTGEGQNQIVLTGMASDFVCNRQ